MISIQVFKSMCLEKIQDCMTCSVVELLAKCYSNWTLAGGPVGISNPDVYSFLFTSNVYRCIKCV